MNKQQMNRRETIMQLIDFEMSSKIKRTKAALEYYTATGDAMPLVLYCIQERMAAPIATILVVWKYIQTWKPATARKLSLWLCTAIMYFFVIITDTKEVQETHCETQCLYTEKRCETRRRHTEMRRGTRRLYTEKRCETRRKYTEMCRETRHEIQKGHQNGGKRKISPYQGRNFQRRK